MGQSLKDVKSLFSSMKGEGESPRLVPPRGELTSIRHAKNPLGKVPEKSPSWALLPVEEWV